MLAKKFRLSKGDDIGKVKKEGVLYKEKDLSILVITNSSWSLRFGFVVSLKISKKAVVRNNVRRMLAKSVSEVIDRLTPGYDILFLVRPSVTQLDAKEVKQEVESVLNQAKILK